MASEVLIVTAVRSLTDIWDVEVSVDIFIV